MAEGVIAAPPERLRAVLLDYERHHAFMKNIGEIRILSRGPGEMLVYQRLDLPVLADRDMVLRVSWGADGPVPWTRFKALPGGPPPPEGTVRVTDHEGGWRLEPIEGGRATLGHYQMHIDLGGSLPGWMARSQAGKDVPDLFEAIRRQVR